jgi:hypothetical protein
VEDDKECDGSTQRTCPIYCIGRSSSVRLRESGPIGDNLEAQFHSMGVSSDHAVFAIDSEAMLATSMPP